ncbi:MAG: deoxyribonuclease IV [Phycisphaerae bacterium]|nr:deoxyribonuclease IV [Phycisphaerae bacterium]
MIGSHLSIAGSMSNALHEAESLGLDTVQVFTKSQKQWKAKPLDPGAVSEWRSEVDRLGWQGRTVTHASYLVNLASPDDELWEKSIGLMRVEIERCEELGIPFLVHHPGAYTTSDAETGLRRIADAYKRVMKDTEGFATVCCLENTVGSGSNLGRTFEELAELRSLIIERTGEPDRVGFCFDTCHAHAGGYDLGTREGGEATLNAFDELCGLEHLRVLHMNDSLADFDSRRDRHAHIGEGTIGRPPGRKSQALKASGFAAVMNRAELADRPKILETPKGEDERGNPLDAKNIRRLRALVGAS